MLEQEVFLTEWGGRKGEKHQNEALLMLLCCCVVTAEGHYAYCKPKGFSWKYQGTKMKRWIPSSLHMAGSDVAMLTHMRPCFPRWLTVCLTSVWPPSPLTESVAFTDQWSRLRPPWDQAKCRHAWAGHWLGNWSPISRSRSELCSSNWPLFPQGNT